MENSIVVVAVDDKWNENNGAYQVAYLWDGESVTTAGGMYCNEVYHVNCTDEQFEAAKAWQIENTERSIPRNKYCYNMLGANTYIGCKVKLARSRKAPNKTVLTVTDFHESYFSEKFNNRVPEQFTVTDGVDSWTVSTGCLAEVVEGVKQYPSWCFE